MRNIPQNSDYKEPLFQWLQEVITQACTIWWDVRASLKLKIKTTDLNTYSLVILEKWYRLA